MPKTKLLDENDVLEITKEDIDALDDIEVEWTEEDEEIEDDGE